MLEIKEEDMYASDNLFVILDKTKKKFYFLGFEALQAASKGQLILKMSFRCLQISKKQNNFFPGFLP